MDVNQIFHMNGGAGEDSYAQNSSLQSNILSMTKHYTEQALVELLSSEAITEGKIGIADLGCSSGPTALDTMMHMLTVVHDTWQKKVGKLLEVAVYLNDLPGNDFNYLFGSFPGFFEKLREVKGDGFGSCFVFGAPGSFYGGLFPSQSLHFVHSSTSLHWLSRIPRGLDPKTKPTLNKGNIYISRMSSKEVMEAYHKQFESDFASFLGSRSNEVVTGGRMVLSLMGRVSIDPMEEEGSYMQWQLIACSLMTLVSEGKVEEEKVDSFNLPYYAPCPEEIIHLVQTQGSFHIDRLRTFDMDWDGFHESDSTQSKSEGYLVNEKTRITRGEKFARVHRAVLEPLLESHFGKPIMDELFRHYGVMVDSYLGMRVPKFTVVVVCVVRKQHEV